MFAREAIQKRGAALGQHRSSTGKRQLFKEIEPPDRAGVLALGPVQIITARQDISALASRVASQTCMSWKDYADSFEIA